MQNRESARACSTILASFRFTERPDLGDGADWLDFRYVSLISVRRAAHSKPFVGRLSELLAGSRIRTQGNIADELATSLSPRHRAIYMRRPWLHRLLTSLRGHLRTTLYICRGPLAARLGGSL